MGRGREDGFPSENGGGNWFSTTRWSLVARASKGDDRASREALSTLCKIYWPPVYAYIRRKGHDSQTACDFTQDFFASFLESKSFARADPERGRLRAYLLGAVNHYLSNEWHRGRARKRGGGAPVISLDAEDAEERTRIEPSHDLTPEKVYEKQWAFSVLEHVLTRLRHEKADSDHPERFKRLLPLLTGEGLEVTYHDLAGELGMTEANVKVTMHRLRRRYGELLREEIAHTLDDPSTVDEELRHLLSILSS